MAPPLVSADVLVLENTATASVHSLCPENEFNSGSGELRCDGCDSNFPSDLYSDSCKSCSIGEYACCGSLACSSIFPTCTSVEEAICSDPTPAPTLTPSGVPTTRTWQPSAAPSQASESPTRAPTTAPFSAGLHTSRPSIHPAHSPSKASRGAPAVSRSWSSVSLLAIVAIDLSSVAFVFFFLGTSYNRRLKRWPSFSQMAVSLFATSSTGIELAFCSSVNVCEECPNGSGLLVPVASVLMCTPMLVYHLRRFDNALDRSLIWDFPSIVLALLDGYMAVWLPWRETSATLAWGGFPDRSLISFSMVSVLSRKIPTLIWMCVVSDSEWRNVACAFLSGLAISVTTLSCYTSYWREPELVTVRKESAYSSSDYLTAASDDCASDTREHDYSMATPLFFRPGDARTEASSDAIAVSGPSTPSRAT